MTEPDDREQWLCQVCDEVFSVKVWHCLLCDGYHWQEGDQCKNCRKKRIFYLNKRRYVSPLAVPWNAPRGYRLGKHVRVRRRDFDEWLERQADPLSPTVDEPGDEG